ncbi:hypothetical protein [Lichenicoccus sp.]|uniref:hypothetical protein n=1 Tax=Lichenicoccus sp. TaxID=2781899 RepID=UPI003D10C3EA
MKIDSELRTMPSADTMSTDRAYDGHVAHRATPERLAKASGSAVSAGVQRLTGPLLALLRAGDIEAHHVAAADRWYRDYVLGVQGARDPETTSTGRAPDIHAGMLSRVAACGRHRDVGEALGLCAEVRLRLLLIDELSFSAIASKLMPRDVNGRKKIAAQMIFLLEQLAEHYARLDQARCRRMTQSFK